MQIYENLMIQGSRNVPHKIWARSIRPFWRLMDTKKTEDKQSMYIEEILTRNDAFGHAEIEWSIFYNY